MIGKDDLLTVAMIKSAMKDFGNQLDELMRVGIPKDALKMFGMLGYKFVVNVHGEFIHINTPSESCEDE